MDVPLSFVNRAKLEAEEKEKARVLRVIQFIFLPEMIGLHLICRCIHLFAGNRGEFCDDLSDSRVQRGATEPVFGGGEDASSQFEQFLRFGVGGHVKRGGVPVCTCSSRQQVA